MYAYMSICSVVNNHQLKKQENVKCNHESFPSEKGDILIVLLIYFSFICPSFSQAPLRIHLQSFPPLPSKMDAHPNLTLSLLYCY